MSDVTGYDRNIVVPSTGSTVPKKYHDNGDGTFAEVVYAGGSALPTGAATSARQDTLNNNLGAKSAAVADVNAPGANAAAVITYAAAGAGVSHVLGGVAWSYDADPTGGRLTITDDGNTVFDVNITSKGPGFFTFPRPKKGTANKALVITLAAGGSGVTGKVNATSHWTE